MLRRHYGFRHNGKLMDTPISTYTLPYEHEEVGHKESHKHWSWVWRFLNTILAVFFALAALVQINDPDPFIWVPIYLVPALLSLVVAVNPSNNETKIWQNVCIIHLGICLVGAVYCISLLVQLLAEDLHNPLIHEEGRELGGLLIIFVWLLVCRFTNIGSVDAVHHTGHSMLAITGILGLAPFIMWLACFVEDLGRDLGHCQDMFPGILGKEPLFKST